MSKSSDRRVVAWARLASAGISLLLLSSSLTACGGASGGKGHGTSPGETVYVEGKISMRGSFPFPLLLLESNDGVIFMIDSSPKADELKRLDEMAVGVTAKVLPEVKGENPAISVVSYQLLPLPTGERPVVGVIVSASPDGVVMKADDESTWLIEGDFKTVFLGLAGAKIWIVGDRRFAANTRQGDVRSINVTQYGVIRDAN